MSTSFRAGTVSSCDVSAAEPGTRLQSPVGLQHFLFFIANVKLPAIPTDGGWPVEASSLLGGLWSRQESLIAISLLLGPYRAVESLGPLQKMLCTWVTRVIVEGLYQRQLLLPALLALEAITFSLGLLDFCMRPPGSLQLFSGSWGTMQASGA